MQTSIQKITPFLWFDNQAEEAVSFYTSIFKNSRIVSHYPLWRRRGGGLRKTEGNGHDHRVPA